MLAEESLKDISYDCRKTILTLTNHAKNGHVGGSLSEIDILVCLYFAVMQINPQDPNWENRDRFILSKGHASPGYYTALAKRGYFDEAWLDTFDGLDSHLQAHPDMHKCPGVDYSTGSLGQGLSVGIGIAEGAALAGKSFKTFVLLGDGESQEGQVWEALMYAGSRKLRNIVAIIDYNGIQLSTTLADGVDLYPLPEKLKAFNWNVIEAKGNEIGSILPALMKAKEESSFGPVAVVAHTTKGFGVSFMENKYQWHGKAPNDEQLAQALAELRR